MKERLTIVHLYPKEMDTYGDTGNVLVLADRLARRGVAHEVVRIGVGQSYDLRRADIVFGGGGQDRAQAIVAADLMRRRDNLLEAAAEGVVMLAVCGTYQLFGRWFMTSGDEKIPGVGLLGVETVGGSRRMIGDVVVATSFGPLVGFENHSGQTRLDEDQAPLGVIVRGRGNDGESGWEGAVSHNVYGTYLHGPVLSKNPRFADVLLLAAAQRSLGLRELRLLDDGLEVLAARNAASRHLGWGERMLHRRKPGSALLSA